MLTTPEHSTDDPAAVGVSIRKWPFFLGDFLLVTAALAVWATQPQLSKLEILFCLGAVGLGAMLFVFPYAFEFLAQARRVEPEDAPARVEEIQRLAAIEGDMRRQVRAAMEALEQANRANAALEASARRFETRLAPLSEIQKKLEDTAAGLREAVARPAARDTQALPREWEKLRQDQAEKFQSTETKLAALAETLAALTAQLESLAARPALSSVEAPVSEPKSDHGGSLLAKALASVQPADESPAVAGIIQSRPRRLRKPKPSPAPLEPATITEPTPSEATAPAQAESAEREGWESLAVGKFDSVTARSESESAAPAIATVVADELPAPVVDKIAEIEPAEPVVQTKRSARAKAAALREEDDDSAIRPSLGSIKAGEAAQTELLSGEVEATRKRRAKPAADAASLLARVLIGIGNKPFVRGEGPGLSADKGVPMEFVEIGKWRWVATAAAKEPITLRILKNDEVPAEGDPIVLKPGQAIEVSPVFPN